MMSDRDIANQICQQYSSGKKNFRNAQLENANLFQAVLPEIDLNDSQLDYANLEQANLSNASLNNSSLIEANLSRANLDGANLTGADLRGANLTGASVIGANFTKANLAKTNLSLARLVPRNPKQDNLSESPASPVSFDRANLTGTFFMGVDLSQARLNGALYNSKTKFGSNFNPVDFGMVYQDEAQTSSPDRLLVRFNYLLERSSRYLGPTITAKYFNSSRPEFSWLKDLTLDRHHQIVVERRLDALRAEQHEQLQQWLDAFTKSCTEIIKGFPEPNADEIDDSDPALF